MVTIETKFQYHNVGQGLFYTGRIGDDYNFVYDCGSKPKNKNNLDQSIASYRSELGQNDIDLLIISHFHEDHILGLPTLLNNLNVGVVILPYFSPYERFLLASRKTELPPWYRFFLEDPIAYISEKCGRIVIMGGRKPEKELPQGVVEDKDNKNVIDDFLVFNQMPDDEELIKDIQEYESDWSDLIRKKKIIVKKHNGFIEFFKRWRFRFFNYRPDPKEYGDFLKFLKLNGINPYNYQSMKGILSNPALLDQMRLGYRGSFNKVNNTSLVVFHGPYDSKNITGNYCETRDILCACGHEFCSNNINPDQIGQLLTGDIDLKHNLPEFINHFGKLLDEVSLTQIPHHGAKSTWKSDIVQYLPNSYGWIVSAGISSQYGHPSVDVLSDILDVGFCVGWCNELNKIIIEASIQY